MQQACKFICNRISGIRIDFEIVHPTKMGCPTNMAEWQVAHWTRMSHQRSLIERNHGKEKIAAVKSETEKGQCLFQGTFKTTLKDDHAEDLNPLTKDWRKSLRTWEHNYWFISDHPSTSKSKKKVRWTKDENK